MGTDRISLRTAETVGEGARLGGPVHHLPLADASEPTRSGRKSVFSYGTIVIMLVVLFIWFIILVLLLP